MTFPTQKQPGLIFYDQRNIISCLFDFILEIACTREALERYWEAIARDIEIQDQRESLHRKAQNKTPQ
jgi:hypothetical protein